MTLRVPVNPALLEWALTRSGADREALARRFRRLPDWLAGTAHPTLKQLEAFAGVTRTGLGYFFLPEPPEDRLPVPDFRTLPDARTRPPSVDLLDTIYLCQQRQAWYRDYARLHGEPPVAFVGTAQPGDDVVAVAARMRDTLGFDPEERHRLPSWTDALRHQIQLAEAAGVLVMVSGVVGSNTHRTLDVREFRGFALADDLAPLVFINGRDSKAAQMFTLAHELAHLWLGQSGISDPSARRLPQEATERWCNAVAAEFLVPLDLVRRERLTDAPLSETVARLARRFKVSPLVILRRLLDAGHIDRETMEHAWAEEQERLESRATAGSGGNFYHTLGARVSKRLARALIVSTLEGQTPFTEAFRLLGVRTTKTFYEEARRLEIPV